MRLASIIDLGMDYLGVGIILVLAIAILFAVGYFLIYRKLLKGSKKLNKRKLILAVMFFCYFIVVAGAVLLHRGSYYNMYYDLHLFNSYVDAWNSFSKIAWRTIILNILMFVPLGILLPLWSDKFKNFWKTFRASIAMTFIIEVSQLILKRGIFEVDDIFNNTLGAVIGYGLIMVIFLLRKDMKKNGLKFVACLSPLLLTVGVFLGIFIVYNNQELGNLKENYTYKQNMKGISVTSEIAFEDKSSTAEIYYSKVAKKTEVCKFAEKFFKSLGAEIDNNRTIFYDETIIFYPTDDSFGLWVDYKGLVYRYSKHTSYDSKSMDDKSTSVVEEKTIREALKGYEIDIPKEALYKNENNQYTFKISMAKSGDKIVDGKIFGSYINGKIGSIDNELIEYKPFKECEIISEEEAYEHIKEGKFLNYICRDYIDNGKIKEITIRSVKLDYVSDSKGFFQPVYKFDISLNNLEDYIIIPALKRHI